MANFFKSGGANVISRFFKFFCSASLLVFYFSSCTITKPGQYFKTITRDTTITAIKQEVPELKIKRGDILTISISSLSRTEDEIFNSTFALSNTKDAGMAASGGFLVDSDGNIYLHKLGKVKAEGLTRKELKAHLEKELSPYLKDPIVSMNFGNHHVTVIGEINKPQILQLTEDKVSLIDVLAQSGSLTPVTELKNILVIREKDNDKEFKHINLEDHSIFTSPYYYLQPNDIVVVNQDEKIIRQQVRREQYQQYSTSILPAISVAILIYQVFFRR